MLRPGKDCSTHSLNFNPPRSSFDRAFPSASAVPTSNHQKRCSSAVPLIAFQARWPLRLSSWIAPG